MSPKYRELAMPKNPPPPPPPLPPRHEQSYVIGDLDAAWREAEAALPPGWYIDSVDRARQIRGFPVEPKHYIASAELTLDSLTGTCQRANAAGDTPAAALRALADCFRPQSTVQPT